MTNQLSLTIHKIINGRKLKVRQASSLLEFDLIHSGPSRKIILDAMKH